MRTALETSLFFRPRKSSAFGIDLAPLVAGRETSAASKTERRNYVEQKR
jgi:hypothetical protein